MNPLAIHFASGAAFFSGTVMMLLGLAGSMTFRERFRIIVRLVAVCGWLFIVLSATPLPFWFYAIWSLLFVAWLALDGARRPSGFPRRTVARGLFLIVSLIAVVIEIPHHRMPVIERGDRQTVYVLGDSISAGVRDGELTWPKILQQTQPIKVVDLSQAGATVRSVLDHLKSLTENKALVLLEIGGNDLLGSTPPPEFEKALDHLLGQICRPGFVVAMFELPLPPFHNRYGGIQRDLAQKHGVILIPKRLFSGILIGKGNTLDGLHLSEKGQQAMAEAVTELMK